MCGIVGYHSSSRVNKEALLESLKHRGPDENGTFLLDTPNGRLFLGHQRLRIIDLSENGRQPMITKRSVISYNGEVYNFKELKRKHFSGETFRSETDTEVIHRLYDRLGDEFVHELNGAFAIAIYDKIESKLKLFRDRLGIKPLYFSHSESGLIFASEPSAILKAGTPTQVNVDRISDFMVFKYIPGTQTLFKGIERLGAGHQISYSIQDKKLEMKEYWSPKKAYGSYQYSFNSAMKEVMELLHDSIQLRTVSDVPVCNLLSGGLDSSIIAHHLRENKDVVHYCAVKKAAHIKAEGTSSDFYHARRLARSWGLRLQEIPLFEEKLNMRELSSLMSMNDDLIADGSIIPAYRILRTASKGATVVFSGMGADEMFLGYGGHLMTLASMSMSRLPGTIERKLNELMGGLQPGLGSFKAYKRYLYKLGRYSNHRYKYLGLSVVGDLHSALRVYDSSGSSLEQMLEHYFPADREAFASLAEFERENFLQKNLQYLDRTSMQNSMEARVPFLDHRLVELVHSLPREYKLSSRFTTKHILKEAYRRDLPDHIIQRRKAGFGMPLRYLLSKRHPTFKSVDLEFFSSFRGFDVDAIREVIEEHLAGTRDQSALIYSLITFRQWYKKFIEVDKESELNLAL